MRAVTFSIVSQTINILQDDAFVSHICVRCDHRRSLIIELLLSVCEMSVCLIPSAHNNSFFLDAFCKFSNYILLLLYLFFVTVLMRYFDGCLLFLPFIFLMPNIFFIEIMALFPFSSSLPFKELEPLNIEFIMTFSLRLFTAFTYIYI